jgi:hypothetical protein
MFTGEEKRGVGFAPRDFSSGATNPALLSPSIFGLTLIAQKKVDVLSDKSSFFY